MKMAEWAIRESPLRERVPAGIGEDGTVRDAVELPPTCP